MNMCYGYGHTSNYSHFHNALYHNLCTDIVIYERRGNNILYIALMFGILFHNEHEKFVEISEYMHLYGFPKLRFMLIQLGHFSVHQTESNTN